MLPSGTAIVFTSRASGGDDVHVRTIDLDGGNPHDVETGGPIFRGYLQAVGDHLYFKLREGRRVAAYRVPVRGGPRTALLRNPAGLPPRFELRSVSPDERWALGSYAAQTAAGMAVVPIDGSAPARLFPYTYTPGEGFGGSWAPDGHAFEDLVVRDGATNLWRFPLDGSAARPVTAFASDEILNYRWSTDGKTLAISRGTRATDVVLITSEER